MKKSQHILIPAILSLSILFSNFARAEDPVSLRDKKTEQDSLVTLPFWGDIKRLHHTGGTRSLTPDMLKYPAIDFRNMLTGLITGLEVTETDGNPEIYPTGNGSVNLRSKGQSIGLIVDDVPVSPTQIQLDPDEIESVTLLNDVVSKAMFGPDATSGVLYIRTKHGRPNSRNINVNFERGVSIVDRFPEWCNGADYARLNNQARSASRRPTLYTDTDIAKFAENNPDDFYYPSVDFRSMMLKDTKPFTRANVTINGGGESVRYNAYVGYAGEGDLYKIGPTADYNRLNVRSSIDARISKNLEANVSFLAGLTIRRSPKYSSTASSIFTSVMNHIRTIPPVAFPVRLGVYSEKNNDLDIPDDDEMSLENLEGRTIWGVSNSYPNNPIAALTEGGSFTNRGRTGMVNTTIKYDFSWLLKGLKSYTFLNLNTYLMTRIGKSPDYLAYVWDRDQGIVSLSSHTGKQASGKTKQADFHRQSLNLFQRLVYDFHKDRHLVNASATYYIKNSVTKGNDNYEKQQNGIFTASYSYDNRYLFQGVLNYAGSSMFRRGYRYDLFPSVGLGWVISNENFLKDTQWINFLKLRGQYGVIGYESYGNESLHESVYVKNGSFTFGPYMEDGSSWFGDGSYTSSSTTLQRLANPTLTWEKRKEFNIGLDAVLFDNKLSVELNYYNIKRDGIITEMTNTVPYTYGMGSTELYDNYNSMRYYGGELGVQYRNHVGNFYYSIGGSATLQESKYLKIDEIYTWDYQRQAGTLEGDYWGYVYKGPYNSEDETSQRLQMYADLNGDGQVDDNDKAVIGNTIPKLFYSVNLFMKYKWLDLTIVGTGRAFYDIPLTNAYFRNGWGDDNYSAFVRDNLGGAYPILRYSRATNYFLDSRLWLRKGGYFKLQNVELGFNTPLKQSNKIGIKGLRIFLRGANLFTITKIKDVDPESIDAGVTTYPLFRTFTGGIKLTF